MHLPQEGHVMSDMTAATAQRRLEESKKRIESFTEKSAAYMERKRKRDARRRQARKEGEAARWVWCVFGNHRIERHMFVREMFANAIICMECQFRIVESLESAVEVPAVSKELARIARIRLVEKQQQNLMRSMVNKRYQAGDGLVYYMRINGRIKIGYTTNLTQRSRTYPPGTELLAVEPGTRETEAQRHNQFSRSLAQGREWFAESDAIKAHVTALAEAYKVPTHLMYRHSKHEGIKHV